MIVLFTSAKGGVGKSTLSVNVAYEMSRTGKTLLFDADVGSSVDHIFFDFPHGRTIRDYVENGLSFDAIKTQINPYLHLVSSPNGFWDPTGPVMQKIRNAIVDQKEKYDNIVIDTPPGALYSNLELMRISDSVCVIVNMEDQSVVDNYALLKQLIQDGIKGKIYLVTNKIQDPKFPVMINDHINRVLLKNLGSAYKPVELGGNISMSSNMSWSVRDKKLFMKHHANTPVAAQIRDLIRKVNGGTNGR